MLSSHTYYVLAGSVPVLVHNSTCGPSGGGTIFSHFTDVSGVQGISGVDVSGMSVGDTIEVSSLQFGTGKNNFMAEKVGDNFVTDLESDATSGQLNQIGVQGDKQNYVIQFSQEAALYSKVRLKLASGAGEGIYSFPANSTLSGGYTYTVTRVR